jgi:hypothetical protein
MLKLHGLISVTHDTGAGRDGVRAGDLLWITRLRRTRTRSVTPLLAKSCDTRSL